MIHKKMKAIETQVDLYDFCDSFKTKTERFVMKSSFPKQLLIDLTSLLRIYIDEFDDDINVESLEFSVNIKKNNIWYMYKIQEDK